MPAAVVAATVPAGVMLAGMPPLDDDYCAIPGLLDVIPIES